MDAMQAEQMDNDKVRKARECVEHFKAAEDAAIRALEEARKDLSRAREKFEQTFAECEARSVERRKSGQIEVVSGY